ncbi:hypothetical protein Q764_13675 [Flavobacterium suncheonense GH29-5 = DSM 17707]|uniref:Uncharacterized protein n=1 Tax=Flavobacterium suncheonense GH29-5 = DSM 17707 TaxID=1121899 RepID=A0A0A2M2K4_9FLAO|nr:hypothetical protein Q764_13675 [Flavobacterium suncheonense GH29-5 = DSM 17707]
MGVLGIPNDFRIPTGLPFQNRQFCLIAAFHFPVMITNSDTAGATQRTSEYLRIKKTGSGLQKATTGMKCPERFFPDCF